MDQTVLNYNELMFGRSDKKFAYQSETITGAADLVAGTVIVKDALGKYRAAVDADKVNTGAASIDAGWRILLEDAAVTGGDVVANTGKSGGIFKDSLVGVGLTLDDAVYNKLEMNNIEPINGTNSIGIAGE